MYFHNIGSPIQKQIFWYHTLKQYISQALQIITEKQKHLFPRSEHLLLLRLFCT